MSNLIDSRATSNPKPFLTGLADSVLREIPAMLDRLIETGEPGAIDLHSLPMTDADREELRERLGVGEVHVELEVSGLSRIDETGIPGVWWVRHEGAEGKLAAELIEVTQVPAILLSHPDDMKAGRRRLEELLEESDDMGTEELSE